MRRNLRVLTALMSLLLLAFTFSHSASAAPIKVDDYKTTIKVACVGDSITFGAGIPDRGVNSYPAQLGRLLGTKWEVKNFGVSGATLLRKGDNPYYKTGAYSQALDYKPDVVVIKLGTNDSKHPVPGTEAQNAPNNWQYKNEFADDYKAMIAAFRKANPDVKLYLCFPVPAFPGHWGINDTTIREEVNPITRQVAKDENTNLIDLYSALNGDKSLFPDTVHPNAEGAHLIANEVFRALTGQEPPAQPAK